MEKNLLCYNNSMGKKRRSKEFKNNSRVIDIEEARKKRLEKRQAEKAKEEEKAREYARRNTRGKMAIRRNRNRRRLVIGIVAVSIIGVIFFSVANVISLKKEQAEIRKQTEQLREEKEALKKQLDNINDADNLEEEARNQLRLIKPGEKLYMFPEEMLKQDEDKENTEDNEQ